MKNLTIQELIKQKESTYKYFNEQDALKAVKQYGYALQFVKEQTEAICLAAVKEDRDALQFVKEQTEAICLAAVKEDRGALQFVDKNLLKSVKSKLK